MDKSTIEKYIQQELTRSETLHSSPAFAKRLAAIQDCTEPGKLKRLRLEYESENDQTIDKQMATHLELLFHEYDADGNGTLDPKEHAGLMNSYLIKVIEMAKHKFIKSVLTSKLPNIANNLWTKLENSNNNQGHFTEAEINDAAAVCFDEAIRPQINTTFTALMNDHLLNIKDVSKKMFSTFDDDHDGKLSQEEFVTHFGEESRKFVSGLWVENAGEGVTEAMERVLPTMIKCAIKNKENENGKSSSSIIYNLDWQLKKRYIPLENAAAVERWEVESKKEAKDREECTCSVM